MAIMLVMTVSLNTFGQEQAVFLRDTFSGTKAAPYWFAKTLEAGLWLPLYAAVYVVVCFALKPVSIMVLEFWLVVWVSMIGFSGVAHVVSLCIGRFNRGIVHLVACLVLIMAFSGIMAKYDGKRYFNLFFTFWTAESYFEGATRDYDKAFDVERLNNSELGRQWDLNYEFGFNIACAFLTSLIGHLIALMIIFYRAR